MQSAHIDINETMLISIKEMNEHLSVINGRIYMLLQLELSDYFRSNLTAVHETEMTVSQIVRNIDLFSNTLE